MEVTLEIDAVVNDDTAGQVHCKGSISQHALEVVMLCSVAHLCRSSGIGLMDLRERFGARAELCLSSWQKDQKLHGRWLLGLLR
jgi:hypothetical protein